MNGANQIVGGCLGDMAARPGILIDSDASSIRREVACKTNECRGSRICSCFN